MARARTHVSETAVWGRGRTHDSRGAGAAAASSRGLIMAKLSIRDLPLNDHRIFTRVDFNVPQDKKTGEITNTARISAALPTIQYILEKGGSVVLASHYGLLDPPTDH